jgi:hypothetical protein
MLKYQKFILTFYLIPVVLITVQEIKLTSKMDARIDQIFNNFQNEIFLDTDLYVDSGWILELPSGEVVTKTFLLWQADSIAHFGRDAVPGLCKWVMNDELYIRYIAAQALEKITGIQQPVPIFEKEDPGENRRKAIAAWNEWYEEHKNK